MLSVKCKIHVSLSIIYIKTYYNLTCRCTKFAKIGIASKHIVTNWSTSYTGYYPFARVYPLPVNSKVHMVNFWITWVCGIGISSKGDYITNGFPAWANPGTSWCNSCMMGRVDNMNKKSDTNDDEDKY